MENALIFASEKEVRFTKLLKFIVPTYLTSLFNTVYTIIDGIFVSTYVGTNALASINIVYPIVNVLTGIALYGLGFLFSGINIFAAIRMMAYGKGYFSGLITFLRSFLLLLLFLIVLPLKFGLTGVWLAVPAAEALTLLVAVWFLRPIHC